MAKKMGRPSSFSDRLVEGLLQMAAKGATEAQMAKRSGVSVVTFRAWKGAHADFLSALKDAKTIADDLVEASLYRRATGYSHTAIKFFCHEGEITSQRYIEHYPPDTTACIFWLKNRRPEQWRESRIDLPDGTVTIRMAYEPSGRKEIINGKGSAAGTEPERKHDA